MNAGLLPACVELFPVRHHSPRAAAVLKARFDVVRPQLVLVEGPSDASFLIDALVDAGTLPPVALLAYRTDDERGHALWPFASYSPEYQALLWAKEHGVPARFIDLSIGQSLARPAALAPDQGGDDVDANDDNAFAVFGRSRGMRSFEEAWESFFEAPAHDDASFKSALLAYADVVLSQRRAHPHALIHQARDAVMRQHIVNAINQDPQQRIAVVAGAAHIAALAVGDVDDDLLKHLPVAVPAAVTLVPFSFPRLAAQSGYGAGNRAPRYYERAAGVDGCDYERATLETFVDVGSRLRARGFQCSLADVLEAFRLAKALADLRTKSAPGLNEVREAAISVLARGDANVVDAVLDASVIGSSVGRVSALVGRNALQIELEREVRARRLPWQDAAENFVLKLNDPLHLSASIFLHRLRIASVPYATFIGTRSAAVAALSEQVAAVGEVGGIAALTRAKESWEARWSPSVDIALVEAIVHGSSFGEVASRLLADRLQASTATDDAAAVLLEAVVADCSDVVAAAVEVCEARANDDDDLGSLAAACRALSTLVTFGSSRSGAGLEDTLVRLCQRTCARALMRAPEACRCSNDGVARVQLALRSLHETCLGQKHLDSAAWFACAQTIAHSDAHPACTGLAAGLLTLAGVVHDRELVDLLALKLSPVDAPAQGAAFLEGFLRVNAMILCRSKLVVKSLDTFLTAIPADRFKDVLPPLRRALSILGATERRYLLENILAVRGIDDVGAAAAIVTDKDQKRLQAASAAAALALDDLDDLL